MLAVKHFISGIIILVFTQGCSKSNIKEITLNDLTSQILAPVQENAFDISRTEVMENYNSYLENSTNKVNYNNALKRLADLELQESEILFEQYQADSRAKQLQLLASSISHYEAYLKESPDNVNNDRVLYQLSKAYTLDGNADKALDVLTSILKQYPKTSYLVEIQFRRGEILFVAGDYAAAEQAYSSILENSSDSAFLEKAQYKLGWAQFKQTHYIVALNTHMTILDNKQAQGKLITTGLAPDITQSEKEYINDVLRVVSLALSYQKGTRTIQQVFANKPNRNYEALLYRQLGDLYVKTERMADASSVYLTYSSLYPEKLLAAKFHLLAIKSYADGGFDGLVISAKKSFVENYGVGTIFWKKQNKKGQKSIEPELKNNISELANYYHAIAIKTKKAKDYSNTATWYAKYISSFPDDPKAPYMNFLLAESQFDAKKYQKALNEYVKTSYEYNLHSKSMEAGYAAILAYNKLIGSITKPKLKIALKKKAIKNSIRFSYKYPTSKYAPAVIAKTSDDLYINKDYKTAVEFTNKNIQKNIVKNKKHLKTLWLVSAHSLFELKSYNDAEKSYRTVLGIINPKEKLYREIYERLAATIYLQAQQQRKSGMYELAALSYLRIGSIVPTSTIVPTAQYDAASIYIKLKQWKPATQILEKYRIKYPSNKFQHDVTRKLALAYSETGKMSKAANEIDKLSLIIVNKSEKKDLTWQAAELFYKEGEFKRANGIYIRYIKQFRQPFNQYIEAHQRVIDYYRKTDQKKPLNKWLVAIVSKEKTGKNNRTDRTKYLAASASIELAYPLLRKFKLAKLSIPLKKSLAVKKKLMKEAVKTYTELIGFQIAEITTASTYHIADIYNLFADDLLTSQRPKKLSADELEQYEILLEEQAFPFEEKSIVIHSKNINRIQDGIYDEWVKKSLKSLSTLLPVRYAKPERIESYVSNDI